MRQGSNPQKKDFHIKKTTNHNIIVVVFIPNLEGYYKNMFEVVKLSLNSLYLTIPLTSSITVVDNSSCIEVREFLIDLLNKEKINFLQLLSRNIGKIDALLGAARGVREEFVTLADCDILYRKDWVEHTFQIFANLPRAASVSPIPTRGLTYATFNLQKDILLKRVKLSFDKIPENHEDYNTFLQSINWDKIDQNNYTWPIIHKSGEPIAIMGSDHQVLTLKRNILFDFSPKNASYIKVGNHSEGIYVDTPIDLSGGYRLSTLRFYAQHMGNMPENWMLKEVGSLRKNETEISLANLQPNQPLENRDMKYKILKKLIKKPFLKKIPKDFQ